MVKTDSDEFLDKKLEDMSQETTTPTRVTDFDFYMIFWICKCTGDEPAGLLSTMIRDRLFALFTKHETAIKSVRENMKEFRRKELAIKQSVQKQNSEEAKKKK